jgi:hypothetical protein
MAPIWELPDDELLRQCEWRAYRSSGPGGQKRSKTSSAVRIAHRATGIAVIATESRSQHENRDRALWRLREALALAQPRSIDLACYQAPAWLADAFDRRGHWRLTRDDPRRLSVLRLALDLLMAYQGRVAPVARELGLTSSRLAAVLAAYPAFLGRANEVRRRFGTTSLR